MAFDRKEYYQRTRDKQLETVAKWKEANKEQSEATNTKSRNARRFTDPAGFLLARTRDRASKRKIEFNLTIEDIVIPEMCPMLGIPLFFNESGSEGKNPNSPSVDRIIPALGYIKGNVVICSWRANQLKNDATLDEMTKIVAFLESIK